MVWNLLAVVGIILAGVALRTFAHSLFRRLGGLCYLIATYWFGWKVSGHHGWGVAALAVWPLLPWLQIMLQVRHLRLPLDKKLVGAFAPSEDRFPQLSAMTDEIEGNAFLHVEDARFENGEGHFQFVRLFYRVENRLQAVIHLLEQDEMSISWASVTSRTADGRLFTTWTFPFSETMKLAPGSHINTVLEVENFEELIVHHQQFLSSFSVTGEIIALQQPEELAAIISNETRRQVDHNLDEGVIRLSGNGTFRYSWRGYLFLWKQFLKDMLRLT